MNPNKELTITVEQYNRLTEQNSRLTAQNQAMREALVGMLQIFDTESIPLYYSRQPYIHSRVHQARAALKDD